MKKPALWVEIRDRGKPTTAKHRKRLKPRSKKMTAKMRIYNDRKVIFLSRPENRRCKIVELALFANFNSCFPIALRNRLRRTFSHVLDTDTHSTSVHHTRGRAGTLLLDERYWMPCCEAAHTWAHNNIQDARAIGVICAKGEWNAQPKDKP